MKLRVAAFGLTAGVFLGAGVFLATVYSVLLGSGESIAHLRLILPFFVWSWLGAFTSLISGFVEGFVVGSAFAWFYNRMLGALGA